MDVSMCVYCTRITLATILRGNSDALPATSIVLVVSRLEALGRCHVPILQLAALLVSDCVEGSELLLAERRAALNHTLD